MSRYKKREPFLLQKELISDEISDKNCICDEVKKIYKAQNQVSGKSPHYHKEDSIQKLFSHQSKEKKTAHTTIPFILYTASSSEPFIGSGVVKWHHENKKKSKFECIESPIFRVKHISKKDDCCAILEILIPVTESRTVPNQPTTAGKVCRFFPIDHPVTDFIATGVCLTVDLDKFIAISCLDPITPLALN